MRLIVGSAIAASGFDPFSEDGAIAETIAGSNNNWTYSGFLNVRPLTNGSILFLSVGMVLSAASSVGDEDYAFHVITTAGYTPPLSRIDLVAQDTVGAIPESSPLWIKNDGTIAWCEPAYAATSRYFSFQGLIFVPSGLSVPV